MDPNGTDFWWDEFADNKNNCWYDNTGKDGDAGEHHQRPDEPAEQLRDELRHGQPAARRGAGCVPCVLRLVRRRLRLVRDTQRAAALAACLATLLLAGCLGSDDEPASSEAGARLGPPLRLTDCEDWREFSPRERSTTLRALEAFAEGRTGSPAGRGRGLDDERAYELFEGYCRQPFARRFKLYKLYTRAAAFSGPGGEPVR